MYYCKSEAEIRQFFEMHPHASNWRDGAEKAIRRFNRNDRKFIYLFNEDDVHSPWSYCTEKNCKRCDCDCFNEYENIDVRKLLRTKKLERICNETEDVYLSE